MNQILSHPARLQAFRPTFLFLTWALVWLAVSPAMSARAAFPVTTINDSGPGSLRQAIQFAAPGDTINFSVSGIISLSTELILNRSVSIAGPGATYLTVSGGGGGRVFNIADGDAIVNITGLTIANGLVRGADAADGSGAAGGDAFGGGIYVANFATLNVGDCLLFQNSAVGGRGGSGLNSELNGFPGGRGGHAYGGAIFSRGLLRLTNCTFAGNAAFGGDARAGGNGNFGDGGMGGTGGTAEGGAIYNQGACPTSAPGSGCDAPFLNCTFSDNAAIGGRGGPGGSGNLHGGNGGDGGPAFGGAIFDAGSASGYRLTLIHCTITANAARSGNAGGGGGAMIPGLPGQPGINRGGGTYFDGAVSRFSLNSLVAGNSILPGIFISGVDMEGQVFSLGHNLVGKREGSQGWVASDLLGTIALPINPQLGILQFMGGLALVVPLLPGSPAIDAGDDAVLAAPYNVATDQRGRARRFGAHPDIGAFEFGAPLNLLVTTYRDSGPGSLREAISSAIDGDTIGFAQYIGGDIQLTSGELLINHSIIINGPTSGPGIWVVRSGLSHRVFDISSGNVTICGLIIAGGGSDYGAGIYNNGTLTVCNDQFVNNIANLQGGAIYNAGSLTVRNCLFQGNTARYGGGIENLGVVNVVNSTFAKNHATASGGAIHHFGNTLFLSSSTIADNTGDVSAGGVYSDFDSILTDVRNCILAGNHGPFAVDGYGPFTSRGFNLIGKADPNFTQGFGLGSDQVGTLLAPIDPMLGPPQSYGGQTPTMALLPGSPAIDRGDSGGLTTDQRGGRRPIDNPGVANATGSDGSDIGAYERDGLLSFMAPGLVSSNNMVVVCFGTELGGSYQVQYSEDLASGDWRLFTNIFTANGYLTCVTDDLLAGRSRVYRVQLLPRRRRRADGTGRKASPASRKTARARESARWAASGDDQPVAAIVEARETE